MPPPTESFRPQSLPRHLHLHRHSCTTTTTRINHFFPPQTHSQLPYAAFQTSLIHSLSTLTASLAHKRQAEVKQGITPAPIPEGEMKALLEQLVEGLPDVVHLDTDKGPLDPAVEAARRDLRKSIITTTLPTLLTPLTAHPSLTALQHQALEDALDLILTFTELEVDGGAGGGWCNADACVSGVEEVLEIVEIAEAERIFGWMERRVARLTRGMIPERGNSLIFLRTQNALLRRLSKSLHTVFCGRILSFLAGVFPIAERSGVNLRGGFNVGNSTVWETMEEKLVQELGEVGGGGNEEGEEKRMKVDVKEDGEEGENEEVKKVKDEEEAARKAALSKASFYKLFWSLQPLPLQPPSLFHSWTPPPPTLPTGPRHRQPLTLTTSTSSSTAAEPVADPSTPGLGKLREGIGKTLEAFLECNRREKEMSGGEGEEGKPKGNVVGGSGRGVEGQEEVKEHYFFPKFLTKPKLLDLEIADPYFRRQVLTQFLIVLGYIRSFSLEERNLRNQQAKPNKNDPLYVFEARDELWVRPLQGQVWKCIDGTPPDGPVFARTVQQIIKRDANWIFWKAGSCQSFEKPSMTDYDRESARKGFGAITRPLPVYPFKVGTPALSKLWENKVTGDLSGFLPENRKSVPGLKELEAMIKKESEKIEMRKMDLQMEGKNEAAIKKDDLVIEYQERKSSLTWRALRIAQHTHLQHFGKIGLGDFEKLMEVIEESRLTKEKLLARQQQNPTTTSITTTDSKESSSATHTPTKPKNDEDGGDGNKAGKDKDVEMEDAVSTTTSTGTNSGKAKTVLDATAAAIPGILLPREDSEPLDVVAMVGEAMEADAPPLDL